MKHTAHIVQQFHNKFEAYFLKFICCKIFVIVVNFKVQK